MRLLYLTQWFDPEPGVVKGSDFVKRLIADGYDVTVVTGIPNYPTGKVYPGYRIRPFQTEKMGGLTVHRLPLYPSHSTSAVGRIVNFLTFFASALVYGLLRGKRFDLVFVYHPPITVGLAAALFGWVHRLPFILDIRDLWPDTVVTSGMSGTRKVQVILGAICDFVYRRAEMIIPQSIGMANKLLERGVSSEKLVTVNDWADESVIAAVSPVERSKLGMSDAFTILYAGNIGRAQALHVPIAAAKKALDLGARIEFVVIGAGIDLEAVKSFSQEIDAVNVRFVDRMPQSDVVSWLLAADVLLINLAKQDHLAATLPSKTQAYMAMGKPILAGVDGETAALLRESGAATVVPTDDIDAMMHAMIALSKMDKRELCDQGEMGKAYYYKTMSFDVGMTLIERTLEGVRSKVK